MKMVFEHIPAMEICFLPPLSNENQYVRGSPGGRIGTTLNSRATHLRTQKRRGRHCDSKDERARQETGGGSYKEVFGVISLDGLLTFDQSFSLLIQIGLVWPRGEALAG